MTLLRADGLDVFYCYAHEDQLFRDQLEQHLSNLKRFYHLRTWSAHQIAPGENWQSVLEEKLQTADLIFLLISPAFMASDYCYTKEMDHALARHNRGEARAIPILLRPVHWKNAPFSTIQMLPKGALPVASWHNSDDAFYSIVLGIEEIIENLLSSRRSQPSPAMRRSEEVSSSYQKQETSQAKEEEMRNDRAENRTSQLVDVLDTHEQMSTAIPDDRESSIRQGDILHKQGKYWEAIHAYMQAMHSNLNAVLKSPYKGDAQADLQKAEETLALDPRSTAAYRNKVSALLELQRYEEVLLVCEQFMLPGFYIMAVDYSNQAYALAQLGRYEEALQACEQALRLKPRLALAYKNKAYALQGLKRYEEALLACERAISLKPDLAAAYALMGMALFHLERHKEASTALSLWSQYAVL